MNFIPKKKNLLLNDFLQGLRK